MGNPLVIMIIPPIDPQISDRVAASRSTTHAQHTPALKVIVTDTVRSVAHLPWTPADLTWTYRDRTTTRDVNTLIRHPRLNSLFMIGGVTTPSPTRTGSQDIGTPKGPTGSIEARNTQPLNNFINGDSYENGDPTSTFSKVIGRELSHYFSANIYLRCRVNFTRNDVRTKIPDFMNLGLLAVHTSDKLRSFSIPATRV